MSISNKKKIRAPVGCNYYDVIILGAGVAGLAAADEILQKDKTKKILILEKNPFVGGLAATLNTDGFRYDLSPHRWFTKNQGLNAWIDELLGKNLIWVNRYTPMYQFGKFFEYPFRITDILSKLHPMMLMVMLVSYGYERIRGLVVKRKIVTMKDAYISKFGWALYKWFNEGYNEKLWGEGGCEKMSADWVEQRVKNMSLAQTIINSLGLNKGKVISLTEKFRYPRLGIGMISKSMAKRITKNGGEIKLETPATKITIKGRVYHIKTRSGIYSTSHIISSIPITVFLPLFGSNFVRPIEASMSKLGWIHQKIVVLFVNKRNLTNFTWVYIHPQKIKAFRFLETNNWSTAMSPRGKTSLVFEYPISNNELENIDDKSLIRASIDDFLTYFAPKNISRKVFISGRVYSVPYAYPKYDLNYKEALDKIKNYIEKKLSGIQLVGRNGMFRYNNTDHSIYTGMLAARNYLSGKNLYDLENVNNETEYQEEIK